MPEVLEIRVQIYQALKKWELMQTVAKKLAEYDSKNPQWAISWSYATCRAESLDAAKRILLEAVEQHPNHALVHYNLACYDCQLGDLEGGKARLQHALKLDPQLRVMALDDEDLKPLWDEIAAG